MTSSLASGVLPAPGVQIGPRDVLAMSAWCGLAAGWLEVGSRMFCRALDPAGRLYLLTRHFVWLVPLADLLLFAALGVLLALAATIRPRPGGWFAPRALLAIALLPALMIAGPRIYGWAWLVLAWGIAMRMIPRVERSWSRARRWMMRSLPALLALVPVVAGSVVGADWLARRREAARPLPPADSPSVLLVVLDTVRADHLGLYGYPRATSRALEALARRGVRFDEARATAPWTLPSHASMFTGRWPHELGVRWVTPLRHRYPTLAGYLGAWGYATAGFVANTEYCSYETGLGRGFVHYEDYILDLWHLRPLRTAVLVDRAWSDVYEVVQRLAQHLPGGRFLPGVKWLAATPRKEAALINREFLAWLDDRPEPRRPFFAFLNYFDAHTPYLPPEGAGFRFGIRPRTLGDFTLLLDLFKTIDKSRLAPRYRELVRDCYDNCLAYLDDRLVELFDALERRGALDRTVVIITADHGEELGGHGLFEHGESLYRPEIRVPLVIVPPGGLPPRAVTDVVSLRDLPATIVDLAGLAAESPFPGRSLARSWRDPGPGAGRDLGEGALSELSAPHPGNPSHGRSPATRGPLVSLAEGDYVYIRNQADGSEQLFDERLDPDESANRAGDEAMQPVVRRIRQHLDRMLADPVGTR